MLDRKGHSKYLKTMKDTFEEAYRNTESETEKAYLLQEMVNYKLITKEDSRVRGLRRNEKRDLRGMPYVAKCPYLEGPDYVTVPVEIQPHDGQRSYKETTWYVKYPNSKTEVRLYAVSKVKSLKELIGSIRKLTDQYGCEWEDVNDENFGIMLACGYWTVYKMEIKPVTSAINEDCGYILIRKNEQGKYEKHIFINYDVLKKHHTIPEQVKADTESKIESACEEYAGILKYKKDEEARKRRVSEMARLEREEAKLHPTTTKKDDGKAKAKKKAKKDEEYSEEKAAEFLDAVGDYLQAMANAAQ